MVRHLIGAGIGLVAVPALLAASWWMMREQQAIMSFAGRGVHGALFLLAILLLGVVVGVLCGGRVVSPVASLVSGVPLLLLSAVYWVPLIFGTRPPFGLGGFLGRTVGSLPVLFILSVVLVAASVWPSRWRTGLLLCAPAPSPYPAQEVHP